MEIQIICRRSFRSDDANFGDFTLLFWRRQLEMYKVKNARAELLFCSLDLFFATSSLPSPSWFARGKESIIFALNFFIQEMYA